MNALVKQSELSSKKTISFKDSHASLALHKTANYIKSMYTNLSKVQQIASLSIFIYLCLLSRPGMPQSHFFISFQPNFQLPTQSRYSSLVCLLFINCC